MRMLPRVSPRSCLPILTLALVAMSPTAAPASPTPAPAPTPVIFAAHAHANGTFVTKTGTYAITAQIALANQDRFFRIDLLSVRSESAPIPITSLTVVLDRVANTATVWNDATKSYYVQSILPSLPGATAAPSPSPMPSARPSSGRSPFADLEIFSIVVALANHTTTAGLATTGMTLTFDFRKKGDAGTSHVTSAIQLADDFAAFPVTIDVSVVPGTGEFSGKLAYAVDDFARTLPAGTAFTVPAGYARADSPLGVLFGRTPRRPAASP